MCKITIFWHFFLWRKLREFYWKEFAKFINANIIPHIFLQINLVLRIIILALDVYFQLHTNCIHKWNEWVCTRWKKRLRQYLILCVRSLNFELTLLESAKWILMLVSRSADHLVIDIQHTIRFIVDELNVRWTLFEWCNEQSR